MAVILLKRQTVATNNTSNISTFILVMVQCFGCWEHTLHSSACMVHATPCYGCVFKDTYKLLQQ